MRADQTKDPNVELAKASNERNRPRRFLIWYFLFPIFLILSAHYFIDIRLDVSLTYFRISVVCIAFGLGYLLRSEAKTNIIWTLFVTIVITLVTLLGMASIVRIARGVGSLMPVSSREWQDVIDYLISFGAATLAGHFAASFIGRNFPS